MLTVKLLKWSMTKLCYTSCTKKKLLHRREQCKYTSLACRSLEVTLSGMNELNQIIIYGTHFEFRFSKRHQTFLKIFTVVHTWSLPTARSVYWKTVSEVLKILLEAAGRGEHFQAQGHSFSLHKPILNRQISYLFFDLSRITFKIIVELLHTHIVRALTWPWAEMGKSGPR